MANVVAIRALFERLGFLNAASTKVSNTWGISSLQYLGLLSDKEVESISKLICSPGGEVENLNDVGAGQLVRISASNHAISMVAVKTASWPPM